jgi:hypothetical protein
MMLGSLSTRRDTPVCLPIRTPLRKSIVLRRSPHPILVEMGIPARGFPSFRRSRAEHLENSLPGSDVLRKLWLGHSLSDVSEKYVKNGAPNEIAARVSRIPIPFSVHCHEDWGIPRRSPGVGCHIQPSGSPSTANSVQAIELVVPVGLAVP